MLARHLARRFRSGVSEKTLIFSPDTVKLLTSHHWPGNVRELANVVEHAMILADELPILPKHLPSRFGAGTPRHAKPTTAGPSTLREIEIQAIYTSLERHGGNKPKVAEELGISLKTLYNKLNHVPGLKKSA